MQREGEKEMGNVVRKHGREEIDRGSGGGQCFLCIISIDHGSGASRSFARYAGFMLPGIFLFCSAFARLLLIR